MKQRSSFAARTAPAFAAAILTTMVAGSATAADPKLDAANEQINAAIASLQSTTLPDEKGRRCRKQADKAIQQLRKVQARINAAKACQDNTAVQPGKGNKKAKKAI